jgi:hypothetical protein
MIYLIKRDDDILLFDGPSNSSDVLKEALDAYDLASSNLENERYEYNRKIDEEFAAAHPFPKEKEVCLNWFQRVFSTDATILKNIQFTKDLNEYYEQRSKFFRAKNAANPFVYTLPTPKWSDFVPEGFKQLEHEEVEVEGAWPCE